MITILLYSNLGPIFIFRSYSYSLSMKASEKDDLSLLHNH